MSPASAVLASHGSHVTKLHHEEVCWHAARGGAPPPPTSCPCQPTSFTRSTCVGVHAARVLGTMPFGTGSHEVFLPQAKQTPFDPVLLQPCTMIDAKAHGIFSGVGNVLGSRPCVSKKRETNADLTSTSVERASLGILASFSFDPTDTPASQAGGA